MESIPKEAKPLQSNEKGRVDIGSSFVDKIDKDVSKLSQASSRSPSSKPITSSSTSLNVEESKEDSSKIQDASIGVNGGTIG